MTLLIDRIAKTANAPIEKTRMITEIGISNVIC